MKNSHFFAMFLLALPSLASEPCIEDGKISKVEFDRPPLGEAGDPTTAEWAGGGGGKPKGEDLDPLENDKLGNGVPGSPPDTATIEVENKDGSLSGPNGKVANGGLDGDCIEVRMIWAYWYKTTLQICWKTDHTSECKTTAHWQTAVKSSGVKEVCPGEPRTGE